MHHRSVFVMVTGSGPEADMEPLSGRDIVCHVLYANRENVNLVHEVFRQVRRVCEVFREVCRLCDVF